MATAGIVNILHTFAMTKHGTCTLTSYFFSIFLFFFLKAETFDAACKLQFMMYATGKNPEAIYTTAL